MVDSFLDAVEVTIDRENFCAFLGKAYGGSATIAPSGANTACAGHDCDAILQAATHDVAPVKLRAGANR